MKLNRRNRLVTAVLLGALLAVPGGGARSLAQMTAAPARPAADTTPGLLAKDALSTLVPTAVFFAGQVAPTQLRNAAGVRLAGDHVVEAVLVDTSGYSSSVQQKYQAYLITEAALTIDGHALPPGAYGCGFIADDQFIVMDIGGATLFTAHSAHDAGMKRPTPLQMQAAPDGTGYRLYAGRTYITLQAR